MDAVPGQKILHSVTRRHGNMHGIGAGALRERHRTNEMSRQSDDLGCNIEKRQLGKQCYPAPSSLWIPRSSLVEDELGTVYLECWSPTLPPDVRLLLMRSGNEIAAGPCGQVADDRGLKVERWPHQLPLTGSPRLPGRGRTAEW